MPGISKDPEIAARQMRGLRRNGKPPGPHKTPAAVKAMVLKALEKVGGVNYLAEQAHKNPGAFLSLVGRILPRPDTNVSVNVDARQIVCDEATRLRLIALREELTLKQRAPALVETTEVAP